jgi:hypothetical protein
MSFEGDFFALRGEKVTFKGKKIRGLRKSYDYQF